MKILLVVGGLLVGFLGCELLVRVVTGTMLVWEDPDVVEPTIGQMMRPGMTLHNPFTGFRVTIGAYSTRENGNPTPARARPLTLAVGDSFTFGEDVSDLDTWPSILERALATPVINGGAPRFGFDQIVLRAEQLAAIYAPNVLVVSFIPDDVPRCESANFSGHAKPYFEVEGDALHMHPIAPPPDVHAAPDGSKHPAAHRVLRLHPHRPGRADAALEGNGRGVSADASARRHGRRA